VCATNADLGRLVSEGRFRQDLLFRINTVEIRVPPLRERAQDILPLATATLLDAARRYARELHGFDGSAIRALSQYAWPGNVRELRNVIERAVLLAASDPISAADLRLAPIDAAPPTLEEMSLEDAERALIRAALRRHAGSASAAAHALGLSRSAMYRRMEKLGIRTDV
jgi:DNA-binding NtrC family response regulator